MIITAEYLPLTPEEVPVKKTFSIGGYSYKYEFKYNDRCDFYTCFIYSMDDVLLYTAKIVYDFPLIHATVDGLTVPYDIVAFDLDQVFADNFLETVVNSENLNNNVKLYINNPVIE